MTAYYNEFDPKAAAWLRELIKAGHIAPGDVDERSIVDIRPSDLIGYTQCHFFAGIGVWSYTLRRAGWPDDRPVWTGSCPCQPFSAAGKGAGFTDERHLWPHFHWLIENCRPPIVFGEQVASKDGLGWLDLVQADLEGSGYASGAVDTCAAGFGAPHTVAPGGLGKTANSIVEALAMASGKALNGVKPTRRLEVWLFNVEDPRDELERRIMAACIHFNLKPEDIDGHLFLDSGREQELVVAIDDKKGVKIQEPIVEAVAETILANGIDVMIVDPFVSTHQVNENDNGAIDKVAKLWAQIADYTNCSIDIVHHLRNVSDREATVEDARGAVVLIGAARSVRVLNRMSEGQANEAGIPGMDRFGYFSITYGKSNLTPLSHRLDWRHIESVALGNGRGLTQPQDHAPVVTEWHWPSSEEVAEGLTDDQREAIRGAVNGGMYKQAPQAKDWVGHAVAYALGLDIDDEVQKKRAGLITKALFKEGFLAKVEERDPVQRKTTSFVRAV